MRSRSASWLAIGTVAWLGGCGSSGAPAPPATVSVSAAVGPEVLAPSDDTTLCVWQRLGNTSEILATHFTADLQEGTHHTILYQSTATAENLTPSPCNTFEGVLAGTDLPLIVASTPHTEVLMPAGTGFPLAAEQMVRIEAHYLNASSQMLSAGATFTILGAPLASAGKYAAAGFGLWGTKKIDLQPQSSSSTGVLSQAGIAGTTIFAVTAYEHQLGTGVEVWAENGGDAGATVLDTTNPWSPTITTLPAPLAMGGSNGLAFQCGWLNITGAPVTFGADPASEVCLVGVYYSPSHGTDDCFDGVCSDR